MESTYGDAAAGEPETSPPAVLFSDPAQDLATFGIIVCGLVGLLWVRRHTSEL